MYFFFHPWSLYLSESGVWMMASGIVPLTLGGYWKIMSLQRIDGD